MFALLRCVSPDDAAEAFARHGRLLNRMLEQPAP